MDDNQSKSDDDVDDIAAAAAAAYYAESTAAIVFPKTVTDVNHPQVRSFMEEASKTWEAKLFRIPRSLEEVVDHILMVPGNLEAKRKIGKEIIQDFLSQRFGTSILNAAEEQEILTALKELWLSILGEK